MLFERCRLSGQAGVRPSHSCVNRVIAQRVGRGAILRVTSMAQRQGICLPYSLPVSPDTPEGISWICQPYSLPLSPEGRSCKKDRTRSNECND